MANPLKNQVLDALKFSQRQVRNLVERHPDFYPLYTDNGRWKHDKPAWTHWCDGFLPGMMWLFLESGAADDAGFWRSKAEHYSRQLEHRKEDRDVHDLGFIFYHGTYKRWFDATVREGKAQLGLNDVVVRAGQVLAMRFKEKGQYLRSFISDESLFIDIMMNVGVIFYAANQTGDANLKRIARQHCLATRRTIVRGDGSTSHEGIFDTKSGEFLRQTTHQGYRGDSCWSRGLAWSLYGFGTCYELTGDVTWLNTAEHNAAYWLANTPADGVPPWDYDAPISPSPGTPGEGRGEGSIASDNRTSDRQNPLPAYREREQDKLSRSQPDSSAGAIAAVGLFNLAQLTPDPVRAKAYRDFALRTVDTLTRPPYLASDDPAWEGILKRGVYHIHKDLGVDESVMWGEFFYVEALTKALALL